MYIPLLLLAVHIGLCALWFFKGTGSKEEKYVLLPLAICLPVFGLAAVFLCSRPGHEEQETPVSRLYKDVSRETMPASAGRPELDAVVPFDEVLLLSNDKSRREVMMHILRRDPFAYLEMLKTAKSSADIEITHYATTTIMEIQRELDISMQKAEKNYLEDPDNIDTVNRLISALTSYIQTGLLLENRLLQLRRQLSEILEHKLEIFPNSRSAHLLLVANEIQLGTYTRAAEVAAEMREKWPSDEAAWLNSLHVCMASRDAPGKKDISEKLKKAVINWSRAGREEAEFLCG
ncbi:MAG: hypothetical protein FWH38_02780 [Treponema sp.]|nr:hypothetical protein [Treponema sp.]